MSFAASGSSPAVTVTVCSLLQSVIVNVSGDGDTVTSVLFEVMATVTSPVGWVFSSTAYVPVLPSPIVSERGVTVTPGVSLSMTVTATLDAVTPP